MSKITIEIEAPNETGLYPLLKHVFREITEIDYVNYALEGQAKLYEGWLTIGDKGRYKWSKD